MNVGRVNGAGLVVPDLLGAGAPPALASRVALAGDGWTVSFGELEEDARRWQRLMRESGVGRGDRIAILAGSGAGIGGIADRNWKGAGIGAGVGSAVGLATVLLTRGKEVELRQGSTLDVVFDRPVALE